MEIVTDIDRQKDRESMAEWDGQIDRQNGKKSCRRERQATTQREIVRARNIASPDRETRVERN